MIVCSNCGEGNPDRARFCLRCGRPLGLSEHAEERKVVTVLFCDLVGFTARSDHADPEDVKATLRPYHTRVKQEIEHYGGTLDKFVGDAVMGVFGAPVAHEDDPERAVRAALRIQEAIAEMNEASPQLDLAARIGIATGEAVVAFGSGPQIGEAVTGDVVNTAARVQTVAPSGGVAVTESTYLATRDLVDYRELGPVAVKGKADPLAIWHAVGARGGLGVGVDIREEPRSPFVDRQEELALLRATFRRAVRESSIQLVTVTGEPGIGKSRLVRELRTYVDESSDLLVRWRQGRCPPYGEGVAFWAIGEIVKAEAGILESDRPEEARRKLERVVGAALPDGPERDWAVTRLEPLVGLQPRTASGVQDHAESYTAWRRLFEGLAAEHPLVLVFEDLHWGDASLLEFIDHLVEWSMTYPILVVCAARPELYDRHPQWGGGKRNSATLPLSPLPPREMRMLLTALLDRAVLPPDLDAALVERSEGNPMYAEEFVRMLEDRGLLGDEGRRLRVASEGTVPVPQSVQALLAARLDSLSPDRKALLHDAAVVGTVFWAGALAAMSGRDEGWIRAELTEIARKELVRPVRSSSIEGEAEYAFWHLLVRDVAYGQIPRAARGARHRAAARWIEQVAGERAADRAELVAYHYGQALELARAAGDRDVRDLEEAAVRFLVMAGDRAMRLDVRKADDHYGRALALLRRGHPERAPVLVAAAKSAVILGRIADAERDCNEAIAQYRAAGNSPGLGEALSTLATAVDRLGQADRARAILEQARALLERLPPGRELARVYNRLAGRSLVGGRYAETLEWSERALALAERLEVEEEAVRARQFRGSARCELGDRGGLEDLRGALEQALHAGLGEETALAYGNLSYQLWLEEGPATALASWEQAMEFSRVRGFDSHMMWAKAGTLEVAFDLGSWDDLVRTALEVEAWDRARGETDLTAFARALRALVAFRRGDVDLAAALTERFLPMSHRISQPEILAAGLSAASLVAQARGDGPSAIRLVRRLEVATEGIPSLRAHYLPDAVRVLLAGDAGPEAAEGIVPDAGTVHAVRDRLSVLSARALLAEARGDADGAERSFAEASDGWWRYGFMLEHALALLGRGRCLLVSGRRDEAAEPLEESRSLFAKLGADPLSAQSDGLLSEAAALSS